jgi:hypothetical protein
MLSIESYVFMFYMFKSLCILNINYARTILLYGINVQLQQSKVNSLSVQKYIKNNLEIGTGNNGLKKKLKFLKRKTSLMELPIKDEIIT